MLIQKHNSIANRLIFNLKGKIFNMGSLFSHVFYSLVSFYYAIITLLSIGKINREWSWRHAIQVYNTLMFKNCIKWLCTVYLIICKLTTHSQLCRFKWRMRILRITVSFIMSSEQITFISLSYSTMLTVDGLTLWSLIVATRIGQIHWVHYWSWISKNAVYQVYINIQSYQPRS